MKEQTQLNKDNKEAARKRNIKKGLISCEIYDLNMKAKKTHFLARKIQKGIASVIKTIGEEILKISPIANYGFNNFFNPKK